MTYASKKGRCTICQTPSVRRTSSTGRASTRGKVGFSHWKTFRKMEKKISNAYQKLQGDINHHANINMIKKDNQKLLLLLGECNFLVNEWKNLHAVKQGMGFIRSIGKRIW